jgi:hypothetical protein
LDSNLPEVVVLEVCLLPPCRWATAVVAGALAHGKSAGAYERAAVQSMDPWAATKEALHYTGCKIRRNMLTANPVQCSVARYGADGERENHMSGPRSQWQLITSSPINTIKMYHNMVLFLLLYYILLP